MRNLFKSVWFIVVSSLVSLTSFGQVTMTPSIATADDEITIRYDATQGTSNLSGVSQVIMHAGAVIASPTSTSWQYVPGTWGDPDAPGAMTEVSDNIWEITFTPRQFFASGGLGAEELVYRIGMVFREAGPCGGFNGATAACAEGKTASNQDYFVNLQALSVGFTNPSSDPLFVDAGNSVNITASASQSSDLTLFVNDQQVATNPASTSIAYSLLVESNQTYVVRVVAVGTDATVEETVNIVANSSVVQEARPDGIVDGINYDPNDPTKVTLSFLAPNNNSVYVVGDFTDWKISNEFLMKQDGEHFWIELSGLEANTEYGFQYVVDKSIFVADPYADKILDQDDVFIPTSIYPNIKSFPDAAKRSTWYKSVVSVFETNQTEYQWQTTNFVPPAKEDLVIYELLIRDFFGTDNGSYQNLIDTLGYFERLGINAIQLMPVMEFNGNNSWGYNPTFMFAPDKYYGSKEDLKAFIDAAHAKGIAVIFDIAVNHQDQPNPYILIDHNPSTFAPNQQNLWFNQQAYHPFNVFYDMNHESDYTKAYLDTINRYWIREYKIDGYRFDLSKGFTQDFTTDVGAWSSYNVNRIALLKRMADKIWEVDQDSYVILEHFAANSEEKELSDYGMMLWGKLNEPYEQLLMGYENNSDISWAYHGDRGWNDPHLISYMESHDEQRNFYKALQFGASTNTYTTRDPETAANRSKATAAVFYTIPGPKMLWQFGEFGYDIPLEEGDRRTERKPTKWEYLDNQSRKSLWTYVSELIKLKTTYPIFKTNSVSITDGNTLSKTVVLRAEPFTSTPSSTDEMSVAVIANFDVSPTNATLNFPHTGVWYDYFGNGQEINITSQVTPIPLGPGQFKLFTNVRLENPDIVLNTMSINDKGTNISLYPNPTNNYLNIRGLEKYKKYTVQVFDIQGQIIQEYHMNSQSEQRINTSSLKNGLYFLQIPEAQITERFIKQ